MQTLHLRLTATVIVAVTLISQHRFRTVFPLLYADSPNSHRSYGADRLTACRFMFSHASSGLT